MLLCLTLTLVKNLESVVTQTKVLERCWSPRKIRKNKPNQNSSRKYDAFPPTGKTHDTQRRRTNKWNDPICKLNSHGRGYPPNDSIDSRVPPPREEWAGCERQSAWAHSENRTTDFLAFGKLTYLRPAAVVYYGTTAYWCASHLAQQKGSSRLLFHNCLHDTINTIISSGYPTGGGGGGGGSWPSCFACEQRAAYPSVTVVRSSEHSRWVELTPAGWRRRFATTKIHAACNLQRKHLKSIAYMMKVLRSQQQLAAVQYAIIILFETKIIWKRKHRQMC